MPYTTTHVLISILLIELYIHFFVTDKKTVPSHYLLIAAIGGVLPDLEYIVQYPNLHAAFMHSLFTPLIFFVIGILWLGGGNFSRKYKLPFVFFCFSVMSFVHILLDIVLKDGAPLLYPFSMTITSYHLFSYLPGDYIVNFIIFDSILLFLWIFWLEFKIGLSKQVLKEL